jgi:hypothetical protein
MRLAGKLNDIEVFPIDGSSYCKPLSKSEWELRILPDIAYRAEVQVSILTCVPPTIGVNQQSFAVASCPEFLPGAAHQSNSKALSHCSKVRELRT